MPSSAVTLVSLSFLSMCLPGLLWPDCCCLLIGVCVSMRHMRVRHNEQIKDTSDDDNKSANVL